jgi:hypothetical protein
VGSAETNRARGARLRSLALKKSKLAIDNSRLLAGWDHTQMTNSRDTKISIVIISAVVFIFLALMASAFREFLASPPSGCGQTRTLLNDTLSFTSQDAIHGAGNGQSATPLPSGTKFCVAYDADDGTRSIFVLSGPKSGSYLWVEAAKK